VIPVARLYPAARFWPSPRVRIEQHQRNAAAVSIPATMVVINPQGLRTTEWLLAQVGDI